MSTTFAVTAAVVLLLANGFFVAAEFALLAVRRTRVEQRAAAGSRVARHTLSGLRELSLMLAAAQLGITICSLLLGAVAEPAVAHLVESALGGAELSNGVRHGIGFGVALTIVVFLHMVLGEMAPKSVALTHPERTAFTLITPFRLFALAFRPVIIVLNLTANAAVRVAGVEPVDELAAAHSPTDLLLLLSESTGDIDGEDHRLLTRTLELSGLDAAAAMTPRHDIVAVGASDTVAAAAGVASRTGRSRVLVHERDLDHVCGVIHVKDILAIDPGDRETLTAADVAREVPATWSGQLLEDLLVEMRTNRQHLHVVVDEHGVVLGVVTLEDVLEELIGDFEDESDRRTRRIRRTAVNRWVVAGGVRPDELAERCGVHIAASGDDEWDTIAGFLTATLGKVPALGDSATVDGVELTVTRVDGYAVTEVTIQQPGR